MPEKLAEAGFLTANVGTVISPPEPEKSENSEQILRRKLKELIIEHNGLEASQAKKIVGKMMGLGDPFRKSIDILGFEIDLNASGKRNPLLAFLMQKEVQDGLLIPGFINISSFKALYNAVAKNLVAHSEFFERSTKNDYNLIYCKRLYDMSAKEIEEYLELQSKILKTSDSTYSKKAQINNRKIFLEIDSIKELDIVKRAKQIKETEVTPPTVQEARKLNSIKLVKQIYYGDASSHLEKSSDKGAGKINSILAKLSDLESKFAALSLLSNIYSKNEDVLKALKSVQFGNLNSTKLANAYITLSKEPISQLSTSDIKLIVEKILASINSQK